MKSFAEFGVTSQQQNMPAFTLNHLYIDVSVDANVTKTCKNVKPCLAVKCNERGSRTESNEREK